MKGRTKEFMEDFIPELIERISYISFTNFNLVWL